MTSLSELAKSGPSNPLTAADLRAKDRGTDMPMIVIEEVERSNSKQRALLNEMT